MNTRIIIQASYWIHLQDLQLAYLNWLGASATEGKLFLIVDDLENKKFNEDKENKVLHLLGDTELDWYRTLVRSERNDVYLDIEENLIKKGMARKWGGLTLTNAKNSVILDTWGRISNIFATVVDDYLCNIDLAVVPMKFSYNMHIYLEMWNYLCELHKENKIAPQFFYVGELIKDGIKLLKTIKYGNVDDYSNKNIEGLLNWLLMLHWKPKFNTSKIMTRQTAKKEFWQGEIKSADVEISIADLNMFCEAHNLLSLNQKQFNKSLKPVE